MKKILFLCTGNSCRSQMAEGLMRHMAGDKFEVFSAGVEPTQVNPYAIKVMAEAGINISSHRSKSVNKFLKQEFDYVITVCNHAKQVCPIFPGEHHNIHWDIEDPAEISGTEQEKMVFFRKIR
ncbi:MAG: arsenate reductase ArsC, partial [Elusimicrobiota bacterium]